jgi:2-polyprenyl-3-methyl-5-hydroxy-6-metoxy-1,4-benzoquinol methylase
MEGNSLSVTPLLQADYGTKSTEYFAVPRTEMLPYVPASCRRLLDVGCGAGGFGEVLKRGRDIEVWGVEPLRSAAQIAATKLDHVTMELFGSQARLPDATFDCIVFNDVLEHMSAPEAALEYAKRLLSPGGTVVASIPNVRHLAVLWQLAINGKWEYTDWGLLDRTHIRFITRSSNVRLYQREEKIIESISGINTFVGNPKLNKYVWKIYRLLNAVLFGKFGDMGFQQFAVVARPARP